MKINWSVKFFAYKRRDHKDKGVSIRMRVTLRGETPVDIATGFVIDVKDWNAAEQRAVGNDASKVNRLIDEWSSIISEVFARYELIERRVPTRGEVKDLFNDMVGRKTAVNIKVADERADLFKTFDLFTKTMGEQNAWTESTFEKFRAIKQHLQTFDPLLSFPALTDSKMQKYLAYLNDSGLRNTTIAKHLSFVRWFLRWAFQKGYYNGNLHDTFKPKLKGVSVESKEVIYLTQDELKAIETHSFAPSQYALERVRDVFVFCCYTGLRYSDVKKLKRSDIKNGEIHVVTQKTVDGLRIELNDHSRAILDKYKEESFPGDLALPVISNEKMNEHLKVLGQVCKIEEPTRIVYFKGKERHEEVLPKWSLLTTHVARRTFVVMALLLGIPSEVIMRWTGHSRFEAMKPYMAIVDELKRNAMSRFNEL